MQRPYIVCHMLVSLDGKVTGEFLAKESCSKATEVYYEINREYKNRGYNGFICGRVTMESSFTGGYKEDVSSLIPINDGEDYIPDSVQKGGFFAVSFDPKGKLFWKSPYIKDEDLGYDMAQVVEVLTEKTDKKFLSYLQSKKIPYVLAGKESIDVNLALSKLYTLLDAKNLLLEGGSIINGYFLRAEAIDGLSLVHTPVTAEKDDKPLFYDGEIKDFALTKVKEIDGTAVTEYLKVKQN